MTMSRYSSPFNPEDYPDPREYFDPAEAIDDLEVTIQHIPGNNLDITDLQDNEYLDFD